MSNVASKLDYQALEAQKEFPVLNLLTKVLIESLCPLVNTELIFGEVETVESGEKFPLWIHAEITGDLEGQLGLAADEHVVAALGKQLSSTAEAVSNSQVFILIHEVLAKGLEKQFEAEDFQCVLRKGTGLQKDFTFISPESPYFFCPVETGYGVIRIYFSLRPASQLLIEELSARSTAFEPKKIRVFASQLETLYSNIKQVELLETRFLNGPHVRGQIRAQIKKLKRMVQQMKSESLETLFLPGRKLVSEIAKQQGKQVRFSTSGTWLFLDKTLLNNLYEPVLHIIRNAIDHGIEDPSERERLGKPAEASIKVLASFKQGILKLIVSDDGQGIDFEKVRERAVLKGLVKSDRASQMLKEELVEYIFASGFSTRDRSDTISGRGLGLDIVRKGIESVDGTIRVLSSSHKGTSLEICIPLNEDFTLKKVPIYSQPVAGREEEERNLLTDEVAAAIERLIRVVVPLGQGDNLTIAYEAFRIVHSVKGMAGFLGWSRVASFCHHLEDVLKLIADKKTAGDESIFRAIIDSCTHLQEFCDASRSGSYFPLIEIRKLEARLQQCIWGVTQSDERTHLFLGKYHLSAVEKFLLPVAKGTGLNVRAVSDFRAAIQQPFGALVQFSGDRRGFAGVLLPEETFGEVLDPYLAGTKGTKASGGTMVALSELAKLMGQQISELCQRSGLNLQPSAPLIYYGYGQPLRILGNPTYCYGCEIDGKPLYLAGDFRLPQEIGDVTRVKEASYHPKLVTDSIGVIAAQYFDKLGLPIQFNQTATQSDLVGFDGGVTAIISCTSPHRESSDIVLFFSYDAILAQYIHRTVSPEKVADEDSSLALYDCLNEVSNMMGGQLGVMLEKRKVNVELGLPTVFIGKAYVSNFNRLYVTDKIVGKTPRGRFELQVMFTQIGD